MLRIGFLSLLGFGLVLVLGAQNVAEDVLKASDLAGVKFINYVGPVAVIESRQAIIGIGQGLGEQRKADPTTKIVGEKYSTIRVNDPKSQKLSADILILGEQAGVDTIRNLNWIVAGYLEKAFSYSFDDALILADFVTRYNAVYRGKLDYFSKEYVPELAGLLSADNAGLALSYRDWPGKTRIVIPLRNTLSQGPAGQVNAEEISKPAVTQTMPPTVQSLNERKKLADLKESEIVKEDQTIQKKEAELTSRPEATGTLGQSATAGASSAPSGAVTPTITPQTSTATASSSTATPPATAATPVTVTAEKKVLAEAKAANEQRDALLQKERQSIQKADEKLSGQPTTPPAAPQQPPSTVPFLQTLGANGLGQLVLVDPVGQKPWKVSEVNTIRRGVFQTFGNGYLVTAGENRGQAAIRLMILSATDLSEGPISDQNVSPNAPVVVVGAEAWAVVQSSSGKWVVGLYDTQLKSLQLSGEPVNPDTGLTVTPQGVIVQGTDGQLLFLDPQTLKKIQGAP